MRLIDADALVKIAQEELDEVRQCEDADSSDVYTMLYAMGLISTAPTIEAEPVRHGRWVDNCCYNTCSVCENSIHAWNDDGDLQEFAYCPNCGARMNDDTIPRDQLEDAAKYMD